MRDIGPDESIIEGIRGGDASATRQLWEKYYAQLLSCAIQQGLRRADAEEEVAEVFLTAFQQAEAGKLTGNVGPWLRTVTKNRAIDRHRANKAAGRSDEISLNDIREPSTEDVRDDDETSPGPLDAVIQEARAKLSADDQQILGYVAHDVPNEELATYLGVSVSAARQRRCRALTRLKEAVARELKDIPAVLDLGRGKKTHRDEGRTGPPRVEIS